jgi:hypothetical protein
MTMRTFQPLLTALLFAVLIVSPATSGFRITSTSTTSASIYLPLVAQPPIVQLSDIIDYGTSQYTHAALGEVINLHSKPVAVTLEAEIHDRFRNVTRVHVFEPEFQVTLPNQRNPFKVGMINAETVQHVSIRTVEVVDTSRYQPLTIIPQRIRCTSTYHASIEGIVRNESTYRLHSIRIAAWGLHDTVNRGLATTSLPETLGPGEEREFVAYGIPACHDEMMPPTLRLDKFQYAAQGVVVSE